MCEPTIVTISRTLGVTVNGADLVERNTNAPLALPPQVVASVGKPPEALDHLASGRDSPVPTNTRV